MPIRPFSKNTPTTNDAPGQHQELPAVSYIPNGSEYQDLASVERPPSLLSRFDRRVNSGLDTAREQPGVPRVFRVPRLARVLREEDIPGKGVCYVDDNDSYCPKAIDGDSKNPLWGVTKAGKPRKRLAQSCTTCREKKIRCDPGSGLSKCAQCFKFNRDCRFEQQQK